MCCGANKNNIQISPAQQKIIKAVEKNLNIGNSAVKSNRSRPGSIAKECPICKTKTIVNMCPICNILL